MKTTTRILGFAAVAASLAACGGPDYHGTWDVRAAGMTVPPEYLHEIAVAAEVVRAHAGVARHDWGGTVTVIPAPFACPAGTCAGYEDDQNDIRVAYAPDLGLGVLHTAIEHELCHAAYEIKSGDLTEETAVACAAVVTPQVAAELAGVGVLPPPKLIPVP